MGNMNSEVALGLLMKYKAPGFKDYYCHPKCVGEAAYRIAQGLNIDADKARSLGYIHDIGKVYGINGHDIRGYELIRSLGFDEEYANICLTHSYLNNDIDCVAGGIFKPDIYRYDFIKDFVKNHEYTTHEKIINLCDLMCTWDFLLLEERLIDLLKRKGVHTNTHYHIEEAFKLKSQIESMLGYSVYKLFPEITLRLGSK